MSENDSIPTTKEEPYSSAPATQEHINHVTHTINIICDQLKSRGINHDASKLAAPELEFFDKYTPMLGKLTYGTDEYMASLKALKPALDHHYAVNRHHPEHHEEGINGMNLLDVVEMFADWCGAVKRMKDGDINKSIDINAERFEMSPQLVSIFKNTVGMVE